MLKPKGPKEVQKAKNEVKLTNENTAEVNFQPRHIKATPTSFYICFTSEFEPTVTLTHISVVLNFQEPTMPFYVVAHRV